MSRLCYGSPARDVIQVSIQVVELADELVHADVVVVIVELRHDARHVLEAGALLRQAVASLLGNITTNQLHSKITDRCLCMYGIAKYDAICQNPTYGCAVISYL